MLVRSDSLDIVRNLAVEEYLLGRSAPEPVLFLYRSSPAVVIGRNQNPWRERDPDLLAASGVGLARRISGGGAVYHDPGNLNVALVTPRADYDPGRLFGLVLDTLREIGVAGTPMNKSSLALAGRKFSGSAFRLGRERALHHCTLLVSSDLDRLRRALRPSLAGLTTRAVASVPAEVMNLGEAVPALDCEALAAALEGRFRATVGATETRHAETFPGEVLAATEARLRGWDWLYGDTPDFELVVPMSGGEVALHVHRGRIAAVRDADPARTAALEGTLLGARFLSPEMRVCVPGQIVA